MSTSLPLRAFLGLLLLLAAASSVSCAQRVIQLNDDITVATEPLAVSFGGWTTGMWHYSFGEFDVTDNTGGRSTETVRTRGPILDRSTVAEDGRPFTFVMTGRGSSRVRVRAAISERTEVRRPLTLGDASPDPDDLLESARITSARLVFDDDSAAAWDLRIVERLGTRVPEGYAFDGTVTSGARSIRLVHVSSRGRPVGAPTPDPLGRLGHGYIFEEDGHPIAAVQYLGAGLRWVKDIKVWLPREATARERLEWAAILSTVMASEHFKPGRPGGGG